MFFESKDLKSNFLQKKNKEKKKLQQNQQQNINATLIQKSIRAFLQRNQIQKELIAKGDVLHLLLIRDTIKEVSTNQLKGLMNNLFQSLETKKSTEQQRATFYLTKMFFSLMKCLQKAHLAYELIERTLKQQKHKFLKAIIMNDKFISLVNDLVGNCSGTKLLNLLGFLMDQQGIIQKVNEKKLFKLLLEEVSGHKIQIETPHNQPLSISTIILLFNQLQKQQYQPQMNFQHFNTLSHAIKIILNFQANNSPKLPLIQPTLTYLISLLLTSVQKQQQTLVQQISKQYNQLLVLMQDQDDILYFEGKILSHQKMQNFSSIVLKAMQEIFESPKMISMFFDVKKAENNLIKQVMIRSIKMLGLMFQDRKILFLRTLLSSNELLAELAHKKQIQFYEGLKMRLLSMDDEEFKHFTLFTQQQWHSIIHTAIIQSFNIIRKQIKSPNYQKKKLKPFADKNQDTIILKNLSETIEILYKKSLRTKKLPLQIFISKDLTQVFYTFNFGTGAQAMQRLLKMYPFAFTFESRMQKFKKLIKQDKLKHDRTLFLQQEVDDDLIIHVRRGKEFLDAYHSLMYKDLRKKYKLVFFNQQGLQQEGIDGGGLIKEFINRVLKSAFSEVYGLFYQNSQNQLLPNPQSPCLQEYEFIGKIIGKAVYESITIQQKFVQPFLNLVIGRKNSFEDIQYIDHAIYKSLIQIKRLNDEDLENLQQTFVVLDQLPNGQQKYVNLLCPSRPIKDLQFKQVLVTRQNKLQFIMAYSDFKCNKQIQEKTRSFRKGFLNVIKSEWLSLFNNQQLNQIISGGQPDFDVNQLKQNCVYVDYHEKSLSVVYFWQVLRSLNVEQKSHFLLYVTSCSRPPTLGFSSMKPRMCISRDENLSHLPTANTCMNVLRLPDYKDKQLLKKKLLYAIYSKAGFEFA